jgi:tetratricopeptide (TPR) repeat protein
MKRCPICQQTYADETVKFCRQDGTLLIDDSSGSDSGATPISLHARFNAGFIFWFDNRLDEATSQVQKMIELEPKFFGAYWLMGAIYWLQGKNEETLEAYQKSLSLNFNQIVLGSLGAFYGALGRRDEAQRVLNQLLEMRKQQNVNALNVVRVYLGLGEIDKALEWLERAVEERNGLLAFMEREIEVGSMGAYLQKAATDTRIIELLRREGLLS